MITILAAVVGGLLTILGQVVLRVLREWGDVRVRIDGWQVVYPEAVTADWTQTRHINIAVPGFHPYIRDREMYRSITASYSLSALLFNEKDVDTSLHELSVVFYDGDGGEVEGVLRPAGSSVPPTPMEKIQRSAAVGQGTEPRRAEEFLYETPVSIDLPSRRSARLTVSGEVSGEQGKQVMGSQRVALKGSFPNGGPFRREIAVLEEVSEHGDRWRTAREEPRSRWRRLLRR